MNDGELFAVGMRPERYGSVIKPLRVVLWRLLRPFLLLLARRLRELADSVDDRIERLEARVSADAQHASDRILDVERRLAEAEAGVAVLHGVQHIQEAQLAALEVRLRDDDSSRARG